MFFCTSYNSPHFLYPKDYYYWYQNSFFHYNTSCIVTILHANPIIIIIIGSHSRDKNRTDLRFMKITSFRLAPQVFAPYNVNAEEGGFLTSSLMILPSFFLPKAFSQPNHVGFVQICNDCKLDTFFLINPSKGFHAIWILRDKQRTRGLSDHHL